MNIIESSETSKKEYIPEQVEDYLRRLIRQGWSKDESLVQASVGLPLNPLYDIIEDSKRVGWIELCTIGSVLVIANIIITDKRKGYSTKAVQMIIDKYPNTRIHSILTSTNLESEGLHSKLGFKKIGYCMEYYKGVKDDDM